MHVVWFKRDLRIEDHRALFEAAQAGPVCPLFVVEPSLWAEPDMSARHYAFQREALLDLQARMARIGQPLIIRTGEVIDVLEALHSETPLSGLWSHEETGNDWTYKRDLAVGAWCKSRNIPWREWQNHGVQRRLESRNGWAKSWDAFMGQATVPVPHLEPIGLDPGHVPTAHDLGLAPDPCPERQSAGRGAALETLGSFLESRGHDYRRAMSSPVSGAQGCSRLSPHLAWGTISMREVAQATWARQRELAAENGPGVAGWKKSMSSFSGRLHWHCHFIQKLEDAPDIETRNLHPLYDGIRPSEPDTARLEAWAKGETGLPFVDACMRSLRATGWLNFRMRAMVMAAASYHLWLDWKAPGHVLARLFTDYEPGIHWSQVQMQSGTTGINTIRIYNPVKQGHDQDPTGAFTRRWVPELNDIPDKYLQEPWKAEEARRILGHAYPEPIIDHLSAAREARERIWAVRRNPSFRETANDIQVKHGSRKSGIPNRGQRKKPAPRQLDLPL